MIARCDLAPLDGITKAVFRRVWAQRFGGADRYFIPFFSPTPQHILTPRDRRELEMLPGLHQVPQVMTCRAEDFLWAAETVKDLGYDEVNLNLGCPSGTVTAKGKGAGFLARPEELDRFFDTVFARAPLPVSVKTGPRRSSGGCWRSITAIPSPASPSTPGCGRRSTGAPSTGTCLPSPWRRAGTRCAATAICGPWRSAGILRRRSPGRNT